MDSEKHNCPWGIQPIVDSEAVSLADVMSEELAKTIQEEEMLDYHQEINKTEIDTDFNLVENPDCADDEMLAKVMQMQFDREHDAGLALVEKKLNGECKVSVSFNKYRCLPDMSFSSDEDDEDYDLKQKHWDSFEKDQKSSPMIGKNGIVKQGNKITTKHDATVCGRRNACKVMEFPPGISTGDGGGFDMKLSNNVFNSLKVHSKMGEKRAQRVHDKKEKATAEQVLDPKTRLLLYKLINNQILDSVNGCISTGKEAVVFHATGGQSDTHVVPVECVIKVFKTTLNEFKNRDKYIRDDYRFKDRFRKQNPRKVIHLWAEKEMHNLNRIHKAGIPCPEVITLKKHALIMTFIGTDQIPAPKLKEAKLTTAQMEIAYDKAVEILKRLYQDCQLVHADFSEYNLLWHNNQLWVIDVSQSVEPTHPNALEFLYRDCSNVSNFFNRQSVPNVLSAKDLFTSVCGIQLPGEGAELLSQIQSYERNEEILTFGHADQGDIFEVLFNQSSQEHDQISALNIDNNNKPVPSVNVIH